MPIEPFSLEDLNATLQVPIPGIPGAYGEIELSSEGTATIALGAEVPVPLLGDAANAEMQLEINKEGEIAYGLEVNLVGLQIEVMVRGCDVVIDMGYGALNTSAVFPISKCGENEEIPEPEPIEEPTNDPKTNPFPYVKIELPPTLPNLDPDKNYFICAYLSYQTDGTIGPGFVKTLRIAKWRPPGTCVFAVEIDDTLSGYTGYENGRALGPSTAFYYAPTIGWFEQKYYRSIYDHPHILNPLWISDGGGIPGWTSTTMPGGRKILTSREIKTWEYSYYGYNLYDQHGFGFWFMRRTGKEFAELVERFPEYFSNIVSAHRPNQPHSLVKSVYLTESRISFRWAEIPANEGSYVPPITGRPRVKDCCSEIRAELRRLRKELKEIRTDFVEPIHEIVNPEMFTEKILPPKFDDEGKPIKPGDDAVTLPDVLQEIGQQSSGSFDPDIAKVEDENIPVSWEENEIKQELPKEKVGMDWIYRELFTLLHEIRYAIDPTDVKDSAIPSRFIYPGIRDGYEKARTYPELFKYLFLMLDKVGFQPYAVTVEDTNPAVAGNQTERQEYHSLGASLESITKYLIDIEGDQDAHTSFLVRLAYEVILLHQIGTDTQQTVSNIQDFLGYELRKKKESIPMAFNPLADNPANRQQVDANTEESVEKLLPNLLKTGSAQVTMDEYVGRKDLIDFLFEILNAARQKPKGNRLG